jgi:hypothetical protein
MIANCEGPGRWGSAPELGNGGFALLCHVRVDRDGGNASWFEMPSGRNVNPEPC